MALARCAQPILRGVRHDAENEGFVVALAECVALHKDFDPVCCHGVGGEGQEFLLELAGGGGGVEFQNRGALDELRPYAGAQEDLAQGGIVGGGDVVWGEGDIPIATEAGLPVGASAVIHRCQADSIISVNPMRAVGRQETLAGGAVADEFHIAVKRRRDGRDGRGGYGGAGDEERHVLRGSRAAEEKCRSQEE